MLGDVARAIGQLGDPAFRSVLLRGIGLTLLLLVALYAGVLWGVNWLLPDTLTLPWVGEVGFVDDVASWASLGLLLVLSAVLMIPVSSAFTGLFLDEVAAAVEARHYPDLPPATPPGLLASLRDSLAFMAVLVGANLAALLLYLLLPPAAPLIFWALNGYLLGREYFQVAAMRRLGRAGADAMRRRHMGQIWAAGCLMAVPLTVPVLNLLVPVIGAAAFTHLFHRLGGRRPRA